LTSFNIQASSKPSFDMFPRECTYSMRKWLIYALWSCEALGSLQIDIASPTFLACVRYCYYAFVAETNKTNHERHACKRTNVL